MNYGLPYKGSKNRIAKRLGALLPSAEVFYDVFAGGCAMTHWALLSGKYQAVVANDINGMIPAAFQKAITGGYAKEDRWISREDFRRLYLTDPYVAMCFSFANNLNDYCYAAELEPYKRALHYAIFWRDIAPWAELCPETADALGAAMADEPDRHKRRIAAGRAIVSALKRGLSDGTINPAVLDKPIYRKIRKKKDAENFTELRIQSGEHLARLNNIERLESCERLDRLNSVESLESAERLDRINTLGNLETLQNGKSLDRMCELPPLHAGPVLSVKSGDYRALEFDRPGIIYCDPPYRNTRKYHTVAAFDFDAFYSYCESQILPVYISEYSMPEDRFYPIAEITVTRKIDQHSSSCCHEKLYRPLKQLNQENCYVAS